MSESDRRLIEDYLPIEKISAEASREKSVRKGHISTLHLWWARRPLVACRAAVYAALVPASRFVPNGATDEKKKSLGRANAAKFVERLCRYPSDSKPEIAWDIQRAVDEAQRHILEAHAERLTQETGKRVTIEAILQGHAPRPKVLDMFAGGAAIPLEALRLGCESYALDLNPVAHIIELCTLVYPQKYGKPDPSTVGMTGPESSRGENTWGGLDEEVRYWGNWVLKRLKAKIGDLYPLIPDPEYKGKKAAVQIEWSNDGVADQIPSGFLMPIAYLWTRTVTCKNPHCRASVPLVKQTWLCKRDDRYIALKMIASRKKKRVTFEVVEARSETGLGFDPAGFSQGGNATCPFCGAVADTDYVKNEGCAGRLGQQMMACVCTRANKKGKVYLSADEIPAFVPNDGSLRKRLDLLSKETGLDVPNETIVTDAKNSCWTYLYGLTNFGQLFSTRQTVFLLQTVALVRELCEEATRRYHGGERAKVIASYLGLLQSTISNSNSAVCRWIPQNQQMGSTFSRNGIPMAWDYAEINPLGGASGDTTEYFERVIQGIQAATVSNLPALVFRGTATEIPLPDSSVDAVITDPPYYDNIPYANLSDFFYVWLKRSIGALYPEHFGGEATPKKSEAVADATRHAGNDDAAKRVYEQRMAQSLKESHRVLKATGKIVVVYAHKTTLGWATLVEAMRTSGFTVTEAWPLDTEKPGRMRAIESAALASSIFLAGRKRDGAAIGNYEEEVRPELEQIVRERVVTLWEMGISGADLVIACVGAGLRAFTRFVRVEYANGEEVPAERFLTEVETVVLETILARLSKEVGASGNKHSLEGLDPETRFYVLWRYTYKAAELDAGEAIIFANGTHVELDGLHGLSSGTRSLVEKKKGRYRLLDYADRGDDVSLGMPTEEGNPSPLVDSLHRLLWLMERRPAGVGEFLRDVRPNTEQLRLVSHALAGPALKGGELGEVATGTELAALTKLTANWRSVVEDVAEAAVGSLFRDHRNSK